MFEMEDTFVEPSDEKPNIFVLYAIDGIVLGPYLIIAPANVLNLCWIGDHILIYFLPLVVTQRLMLNTGVESCATISTVLQVGGDVPRLICILIHNA